MSEYRRSAGRVAALLSVTATAAVALAAPASAQTAAQSGRAQVAMFGTATHRVAAPGSMRPGLVHIVNNGSHPLMFARRKAMGIPAYVADLNGYVDTAGSERFHRDFDIVDEVAAHTNEYVRLAAGTYYLIDETVPRATAALVHTLTVRGAVLNATPPASTLVQAATNGAVTSRVTIAMHGVVHVVNRTGSPHIISIQSIKPAVTDAQLRAALAHPASRAWARLIGSYFLPLGELAGNTDLYKPVGAKPGRYFLFAASLTHPGLGKGQIGLLTVR